MNLLLDTHTLIWFLSDDFQLPNETKKRIENAELCLVSVASLWEISIKKTIGKLDLKYQIKEFVDIVEESGIAFLPITKDHVMVNQSLQFYHRDPFDRMIIAQALSENLVIVTRDSEFDKYEVPIFWEK